MKQMTFDHKMIRFISGALILSTSVIILVSAISTVFSITSKSAQMTQREAEVMTTNMEDNFNQYQSLIWSLVLDKNIQEYLETGASPVYESIDKAYSTLTNICNMWENINFITILRSDGGGHLSKGKAIPNWIVDYDKQLMENYESSIKMSSYSEMRLEYTNKYNIRKRYTLNIFYPLYSSSVTGKRLGTLCININDANLTQLLTNESPSDSSQKLTVESYFVHQNGQIITCSDPAKIGSVLTETTHTPPISLAWPNVIIKKDLTRWRFAYLIRISWWELLKESIWTIAVLMALLNFFILLLTGMARRMVRKAYEPWGNVVRAMTAVSSGALDTRLPPAETAPDMRVVSNGFNGMMEQIIKLMAQVKEEQFQIDQIRLEALQAQIQPHFLYNTLDCIHWQAVGSGNRDISNMVKALASYYRTCLSKGRGIVTISEELEYVRNYLYIQKIRYEDILNYEIIADPDLNQAAIPKLTLQPLVENAIYHGIKQLEHTIGRILITVSNADKAPADPDLPLLQIAVSDNGIGMSEERIRELNQMISTDGEEIGYGVRNVNRRIMLYYGREYGLSYSAGNDGGVTVTIRIPYINEKEGR